MARVSSAAADKLLSLLREPEGLQTSAADLAQIQDVSLPEVGDAQIATKNVAPDIIERSVETKYPFVCVFCEKIVNSGKEKGRTFSGKAHLWVEVRVSQDRLEGLERMLLMFVDAVTRVLDAARGDWGEGMYYGGGYEAVFGPVKHGGRNFLQSARVGLVVDVGV